MLWCGSIYLRGNQVSKARFIPTKFKKKLKAQASRTSQNTKKKKKKKLKKSKTQPLDLREKHKDPNFMIFWAAKQKAR